jgi:hypothetical protein
MYKRLLLFERSAEGDVKSIGSLLVVDEQQGIVIAARELIPALGKSLCVSLDGTKNKLRLVDTWREVPIPGPKVEPFAYIVRMGATISN